MLCCCMMCSLPVRDTLHGAAGLFGIFAPGTAYCASAPLAQRRLSNRFDVLRKESFCMSIPSIHCITVLQHLNGFPCLALQEVQDDNQLGEVHQDMPDDMRLDDDGHGPAEQLAAPATIPEPDQAPQHAQQEEACACQEPDQAPEAARELPPPAPVQATSSAPAAPAAQKARRRLSLEPTAFTSGGPSHVPAADQPASMQPQAGVSQPQPQEVRRETTGAVSAAPDAAAALPTRDELFAELPGRLPAVQRLAGDNPDSRKPRRLSADAMATPKLSALLSNPMSSLDGFPGHILAAKTTAAAQPPAAAQLPLPSVQPAAAGRSQVVSAAAQITQADQKNRNDEAAAAQQLASEDRSLGFLSGAISTLDGFPGDNFRGPTGGPITSRESARQPQRGAWKAAGGNPSADMSTAQKAQRDKSGSAEMGSAAPQLTSRDRSIGFFSDPISTLDGFPRDILRETTGGLSVFRAAAQADAALAAPTFSNLSFLDAMPTLDGFSVGGSPASQRGATPEEASGRLPGSRAAHALSPIPLRLAADGRLSNGPGAFTRDSPAAVSGESSALGRESGAAAASGRQGREDARSFQERGIWRTEESMDAVLNQDAFEELASVPAPAHTAPAKQAAAPGESATASEAAEEVAPTDFRGLQARISGGVVSLGPSTCGQQQEAGGKSSALSSVFAGGASAETLDAFMRSLKY